MHDDPTNRPSEADARIYELDVDETGDFDETVREALAAVGDADAPEAGPSAADAAALSEELERLRSENDSLRERSMRLLADLDNYRKRSDRERAEERRYAGFDVLRELLGVSDNLSRALASSGSVDDLKTGVGMIVKQVDDMLARFGVERVAAAGRPFDPAVHEAVLRLEDPEVTEPTVSEEMQAGYTLHERLLRPAMVKVAMPVERAGNGGRTSSGEADS